MTTTAGAARWARSPEVAFLDHGERVIVLGLRHPATARPLLLCGPSAEIWRLVADGGSTADIAEALAERYQRADTNVAMDVLRVLEYLQREGLVGCQDPS